MEWLREADTAGLRIIGMSHESYAYSRACHRYRWIRRNYPSADRWLALTQEDADDWIADGMHNVGAMPNALAHLPEIPSPRTAKVVCSIGRLADQKGIDMLVDTWAEVAPRRPGWTLRIYGAGADEPDLRRQCTELGLDGSVEWMGRTDDVAGALAGSAVFVQSSRGEGFPLALMEAMASAVPCAAFDCAPGVREIVRDGEDGLLAPPATPPPSPIASCASPATRGCGTRWGSGPGSMCSGSPRSASWNAGRSCSPCWSGEARPRAFRAQARGPTRSSAGSGRGPAIGTSRTDRASWSSPSTTCRTTRSAARPSSYGQNRSRNAARSCAEREPRQCPVVKMSISSSSLRATAPGGDVRRSKYVPRDASYASQSSAWITMGRSRLA